MPDNLKVIIGGDASGLTSELKNAQAQINNTAIAAQKAGNALVSFSGTSSKSIFTLTEKLRELESAVFTEKSKARVIDFNKQIEATKIEIDSLKNAGTKGFDDFGNAVTKVGNPVSAAYGAIRKLAYILPGIGIAGIIGFATEPIIKWLSSVKEATGDAKILQDVITEGAKGGSEQVAHLSIIKAKLDDTSKSESERLKIATEYNKTAAEGNKIGLDEINNLTVINAQIDKQIGLIEKQSLAKAAQSKIAEFADKEIAAEFKFQEALEQTGLTEDKVAKSIENRGKIQDKQLQKQRQSLDVGPNKLVAIDPNFKQAVDNVELVDKKLEGLLIRKQSAAYELDRVIKLLQPQLPDAAFDGSGDKVKKIETIADIIKKLRAEIDALNQKQLELHTDEAKGRISALEGAIKELSVKFGVAGKDAGEKLYEGFSQSPMFKGIVGLKTELLVQSLKKDIETQMKADPIKLEPLLFIGTPDIKKGIFEDRLKAFDDLKEAFKKKVKDFQDLVKNTAQDIGATGLESLGEALGTALKGGKISGIFDNLFTSVGSQIQNLGKFLIKSGIEIKIAKEAFKKLLANPVASIIVGIGLVALGALIKSQMGKQNPGFATGVRNFQGGNVLVGERGPERIFLPNGSTVQPNNELQAYGENNGGGVLTSVVRGQDLVFVLDRSRATISRNG